MTGQQRHDGRRARWEHHNLARREHILDAALAVLEESGPGVDVPVQRVARAAGLSRTVVYRHFDGRADLDAAVRERILERLRGQMVPALALDGSPVDIIRRIVAAYVGWAAAHPALHRFAEQPPADGGRSAMDSSVEQVAGQVEDLIGIAAQLLEVRLDDDDRAALDPLVFGLVGSVVTAVGRWLSRPSREPAVEVFVDLLTSGLFHQVAGLARERGVPLEPDVPVDLLLASAFEAAP